MDENRVLARDVLGDYVQGPRDESVAKLGGEIGATDLGRLYELLVQLYPLREDPVFRNGFVTRDQNVRWFRDQIPSYLSTTGSEESLASLTRIYAKHPDLSVINHYRIEAEALLRRNRWKPIEPSDLVRLAESRRGRLVESADQLLEVVVDAFRQVERSLIDQGGMLCALVPRRNRQEQHEASVRARKITCQKGRRRKCFAGNPPMRTRSLGSCWDI